MLFISMFSAIYLLLLHLWQLTRLLCNKTNASGASLLRSYEEQHTKRRTEIAIHLILSRWEHLDWASARAATLLWMTEPAPPKSVGERRGRTVDKERESDKGGRNCLRIRPTKIKRWKPHRGFDYDVGTILEPSAHPSRASASWWRDSPARVKLGSSCAEASSPYKVHRWRKLSRARKFSTWFTRQLQCVGFPNWTQFQEQFFQYFQNTVARMNIRSVIIFLLVLI